MSIVYYSSNTRVLTTALYITFSSTGLNSAYIRC